MSCLKEKIQHLANTYAPGFIDIRHHLHANPELSYQEVETSKYIQERLTEYGIPFQVMAIHRRSRIDQRKEPR